MSNVEQMGQDLRYLRDVVARRENTPPPSPWLIYWMWAAYVLVGYILIDFAPTAAGWFFMLGGIAGGFASWWIGKRHSAAVGEVDRRADRVDMLHWLGGIIVCHVAIIGLAVVIPALRSEAGSQVFVVMFGLVYWFWGVHRERAFRWLGLVLIAGGICVSLIPYYRWSCLGAVIAGGLIVTSLIHKPTPRQDASA